MCPRHTLEKRGKSTADPGTCPACDVSTHKLAKLHSATHKLAAHVQKHPKPIPLRLLAGGEPRRSSLPFAETPLTFTSTEPALHIYGDS